jgi:hypothetical protein
MEEELRKQLDEQGAKIEAIYQSVEKMRRYFKITMWVTIIVIVLPIIGLVFAIPAFLTNYVGSINSLGGF